ncbi:MAG: DUF2029 domain-containing protein [Clostridia bacterium]|nr:DUF2029 domain-containing protein [Clostridia bacterium]
MSLNINTAAEAVRGWRLFRNSLPLSQKQNKILNIFFVSVLVGTFVSMIGIILYYVYAYAALTSGDHGFDWLLGIFSDFVFIMNVSLEESPYLVEDSSYPPVAIAILYPFALICKGVFAKYSNLALTVDELTSRVILHAEFWVAFLLFFAICSVVVILAVTAVYRLPPRAALKTAVIIILSAPFVYTVMRGNTIYFALIFLLLFLLLHKSEDPVLRELGLISLTVAGLIKIYPLFFGVFLLHKKKLWASVRVGIYTVIIFLASFLLFNGADDLIPFFNNLGGFMSNNVRLIAGTNLSVTSILYKLFYLFSPETANSAVFDRINLAVLVILFLTATVAAVYTRSDFRRCAIASSVIILIPSISYFYVLIFAFLPFMEFIRSYESLPEYKQRLYTVLFLVIFFTPFILPKYFLAQSFAIITLFVIECAEVFGKEMRKAKRITE